MCFFEDYENIGQYLSGLFNRGGEWWKSILDVCGIDTSTKKERFEREVKFRMNAWEIAIYLINRPEYVIPMSRRRQQEDIIRQQLEFEGY